MTYLYIHTSGYGHYINIIKHFESLDEAEKYREQQGFGEIGHIFYESDRLYFPIQKVNKQDRSQWVFIYKLVEGNKK